MKKYLIAFLAVACGCASCSDDDNAGNEGASATISISTEEISAGTEGETVEVTVTSSGDWRLAGMCDWVHPSAESGKSGDVVAFKIDPNTEEEMRETVYKFFTGSAVVPLKISAQPGYVLEAVGDKKFSVDAIKVDLHVKVHTNIPDFEVSFSDEGEKWVTFEGITSAFGKKMFNFIVSQNEGYDDRKTVITIAGMGKTLEIPLTQQRILAINLPKDYFEIDLSAQTLSVDVEANLEYKIHTPAWIKQQPATRGLETKTLTFAIEAAKASRSGQIEFEGLGLSKMVTVFQKDPNAKILTIPDKDFKQWLTTEGWISSLSETTGIITEEGVAATRLDCPGFRSYYGSRQLTSLEGIEAFLNLEYIKIDKNNLTVIDLSALKKVKELICDRNYFVESIILGDNPITEFVPLGGQYISSKKLVISGSKLTSLDLSVEGWGADYDEVTELDLTGCPALQTLNCVRSEKLKTLRLKKGQMIPNLVKAEFTNIVYVD